MDVLTQSLSVIRETWPSLLGIMGILFLGAGSATLILKSLLGERLKGYDYLAIGAGGALLPLLAGVAVATIFRWVFKIQINFIFVWAAILVISIIAAKYKPSLQLPEGITVTLVVIVIASIFVRLAFIWGLQVPSYFDSAMHYSIIQDLINRYETINLPNFQAFVGGYYHLGFHVLSGAISLTLSVPAQNEMLLFGQILLSMLPLPLFFIIRQQTENNIAAVLAVLLAGWGWYMPAHLLDWGKYPAFTSLSMFEFSLCCILLLPLTKGKRRIALAGLILLSTLTSTLLHSRSLIITALAAASITAAYWWQKMPVVAQKVSALIVLISIAATGMLIQSRPVLKLALDPYIGSSGILSAIVLAMLPFAFLKFPRQTFASLLFILLTTASIFVSVKMLLPVYDAQTLLDRPFAEGVLYLPIAILGGLGFAGVASALENANFWTWMAPWRKGIFWLVCISAFGTVLTQAISTNSRLSDCCILYTDQDAAAFQWLEGNSPTDARILAAAIQTVIFDNAEPADLSGSDAGIWITPFIKRQIFLAPFQTDFSSTDAFKLVCKLGTTYIYAGGTTQSFNKELLGLKPEWYTRQLALPGVQIYKVTGCP